MQFSMIQKLSGRRAVPLRLVGIVGLVCAVSNLAWLSSARSQTVIASGLKAPASVAVSPEGQIAVSEVGGFGQDGDGSVSLVIDGKATPLATGLNDPQGLAWQGTDLLTTDRDRVLRIDAQGQTQVLAAADAFPTPPVLLKDLCVDSTGNVYVTDSGGMEGASGGIFRITADGGVASVLTGQWAGGLKAPCGLVVEDAENLLCVDAASGEIYRVRMSDGQLTRYVTGHLGGNGLALNAQGKLFVSEWMSGKVYVLGREDHSPTALPGPFGFAGDIGLSNDGHSLYVPDMKAGTLSVIDLVGLPAVERDETPLALSSVRVFEQAEFNRPVVLTHAGDGTNRVFVCSELGQITVLPDGSAGPGQVFLDLVPQVSYKDSENEEGLLGMAFHPKFRQNRQFFVFYSSRELPHVSVISRFRALREDPNRADPKSEEIVLRIQKPFWNHTGGTLVFGPDGYLYIGLGDGGAGNDPIGHGQDLKTLLGSILRIDVDRRDPGRAYAIPRDNPFRGREDARGEIWAYGIRNTWRMSFDPQTGDLWAADVGQDLWEEVNLITRGGNFGWNLREARHKFGTGGVVDPRPDLIEPIFEYHHDVGKSITGGHVYRGQAVPELQGAYLYADYVSGKLYALRYNKAAGVVTANQPIPGNIMPVMSFGEDEQGEVYYMTTQNLVYRLGRAEDDQIDPVADDETN